MHGLVAMARCGEVISPSTNKVQLMIGYMGHVYHESAKDDRLFVII